MSELTDGDGRLVDPGNLEKHLNPVASPGSHIPIDSVESVVTQNLIGIDDSQDVVGSEQPRRSPRNRLIRRFLVATVGFTIVAVGLIMMVLPGPGIVTIIAGISILATEFVWAKSLKEKALAWVRSKRKKPPDATMEE